MDTDKLRFDPEDEPVFRRVWERVTARAPEKAPPPHHPGPPPPEPSSLRTLRAFLEDELRDWHNYQALERQGLREAEPLAAEELRHAKRLSAMLFLLCGIHYFPKKQARPVVFRSIWAGLRRCYESALKDSERYREAAVREPDPKLRQLYEDLSREERAQAARLRRITEHRLPR